MSVYIIAEAGVNHNGSVELAKELVKKAKEAGVDCVKFQTYVTENLVTYSAKKAKYQIDNTKNNDSQYSMLKKLELSFEEFKEIKNYCDELEIDFISTPFDFESIEFLKQLKMKFWKIPSGEITNYPYIEKIAATEIPIILSTGMSDMEEVKNAVKIIKKGASRNFSILHCTTQYPAPLEECNFNVLDTLKNKFGVKIGYSDHTEGILAPIVAVAKGAEIIEKHFTLDKNMEGPDHKASLEPDELREMVRNIRMVEKMLGNGIKEPTKSETINKAIARKSIVAKRDINKGEIFSEDNLTIKRPGTGISPMRWNEIIGTMATQDYMKDELI